MAEDELTTGTTYLQLPDKEPNPLWLPEGSVRSILAISSVGIAGYLMIYGPTVPEWFVGLITLIVKSYFDERGK